jgi:hypothetical protein
MEMSNGSGYRARSATLLQGTMRSRSCGPLLGHRVIWSGCSTLDLNDGEAASAGTSRSVDRDDAAAVRRRCRSTLFRNRHTLRWRSRCRGCVISIDAIVSIGMTQTLVVGGGGRQPSLGSVNTLR